MLMGTHGLRTRCSGGKLGTFPGKAESGEDTTALCQSAAVCAAAFTLTLVFHSPDTGRLKPLFSAQPLTMSRWPLFS